MITEWPVSRCTSTWSRNARLPNFHEKPLLLSALVVLFEAVAVYQIVQIQVFVRVDGVILLSSGRGLVARASLRFFFLLACLILFI